MKIAFFLGALKRGGAESLVYDICRKRHLAPFNVYCLYRKDDNYSSAFKATDVEFIQVQKTGNIVSYLFKLRKAILNNHIDIVHAQTPSNALVGIISTLGSQVKIVTTFHGFSFSASPKWYRRIVYGFSKRIICVSEYEKQFYEQKWGLPKENKLQVIYNGIDFSKMDSPEPDKTRPVHVDPTTLNMIMVGSFISGRSQFFICQVMDRLNQMGFQFNMYFAGRRDESEYLRYDECVSFCEQHDLMNKVHFLGNRIDIPYLLRQMDFFIYASEHDTFGIAIIESLACGLPVIVNDWVVMKEVTCNGEYALLYRTSDINDCVEKINLLIGDKDRQDKRDKTAQEIRSRYSVEKHICELNALYNSCLQ